jgi:hypothetical protein
MPFDATAVDAIDVINVETGKEEQSLRISNQQEIKRILAQLKANEANPSAGMQQWLLRLWSGGMQHRDVLVYSDGQWWCGGVLYGDADALPKDLSKIHGKQPGVLDGD